MMIVVVDEQGGASVGFERAFTRESVPFATFMPEDFRDWMDCLDYGELSAIEAFLLRPGRDSASLPRLIRRKSAAPVIAVMERRRIEQTLLMFEAGVDDVVEQPVDARELFARIGAIRRRSMKAEVALADDINVHADGRDPEVLGQRLELPRRERRILQVLDAHRGRWLSRQQLHGAVYGMFDDEASERAIESHVSKLRRKLRERLGYDPIDCQRYLGYRLAYREPAAARAA